MNDDIEKRIRERIDQLRTERDELRVRLHLAASEVKDEWEELEEKLEHLETRLAGAREEASNSAGDLLAALELLGDEIKGAYARIRHRLRD